MHAGAGIAHLARQALSDSRYSALKGVDCDESGGLIRLGGGVPSQCLKQLALVLVSEVDGSRPVRNEIQVVGDSS